MQTEDTENDPCCPKCGKPIGVCAQSGCNRGTVATNHVVVVFPQGGDPQAFGPFTEADAEELAKRAYCLDSVEDAHWCEIRPAQEGRDTVASFERDQEALDARA